MHKRSIFSRRFDKKRQQTELQWQHAFTRSKLFPKISESSSLGKEKFDYLDVETRKMKKKGILNSNEWYDSDKLSITDRYLLEQKFDVCLLEKFPRESISLVVASKDDTSSIEKNNIHRRRFCREITKTIDKIKILSDVLKIDVLEETLNDLNFNKFFESCTPPSQQISLMTCNGMYVCFFCDKRFKRSWILSNHLLLHKGVKPFTCEICTQSFADLSNLRSHQRCKGHHSWKYSCTQCSKAFHSAELLNRHTIHACRRYLQKSKKLK